MNKIDHFEGDNDHVDEEFDSESEYSARKRNRESISDGLDSDSKFCRLSLTPGCNIITSNRDENRSFSDLSAKVVNINSIPGISHNPFSNPPQLQKDNIPESRDT